MIMRDIRNIGKEMTHTCYRCSHSFFYTDSTHAETLLRCCVVSKDVESHAVTQCPRWNPSLAVQMLQDGNLDQQRKLSLLTILEERRKHGCY